MFNIVTVTQPYLQGKVDQFINIVKDQENDYWESQHFLMDKKGKWEYSIALERDGEVIGFLIASISDELQTLHIHKFMMASGARGAGYGTTLFNHFLHLTETAPYRDLSLKVHHENYGALKLYHGLGFKVVDDSSVYLLMRRNNGVEER